MFATDNENVIFDEEGFFYALYDALSLVFLLIQKMEREIIPEHQTCVKDEKDRLNNMAEIQVKPEIVWKSD